ncbi:hypothetical protein Tco_0766306 [Tanacetum coccineum]|uniref:Uncharacterized protein n=1 Tax=Tanacetum coccineum TaxID=301880 RepID=A0ABQ5HJ65_9ASTR
MLSSKMVQVGGEWMCYDGAFGGGEDEEVVVGEGYGGDLFITRFIPKGVCQNAEIIAVPRWDSGQLHRNSKGHSRRIRDL